MARTWTKEEVRNLKKIFRNASNKDVARHLNRTVDSVEIKARRLGLHKTKKYLRTLGR